MPSNFLNNHQETRQHYWGISFVPKNHKKILANHQKQKKKVQKSLPHCRIRWSIWGTYWWKWNWYFGSDYFICIEWSQNPRRVFDLQWSWFDWNRWRKFGSFCRIFILWQNQTIDLPHYLPSTKLNSNLSCFSLIYNFLFTLHWKHKPSQMLKVYMSL